MLTKLTQQRIAYCFGAFIGIAILAGLSVLVLALYNYVAIPFVLPKLSFIQFIGTIALIDILLFHFKFFINPKNNIQIVYKKDYLGEG